MVHPALAPAGGILEAAEAETDLILWDGGNNDTPFIRPDLDICVVDPHRAGHELRYWPGEANLRRAGVIVINKVDSARSEDLATMRRNFIEVNHAKSGTGRPWERKFLGFRLDRKGQITLAPESLAKFKTKVRELWRRGQSLTSTALRDRWASWLRGWWEYYRLAEQRDELFGLEGWIRRHIRKCFWLRWHNAQGRRNALRRLGVGERLLRAAAARRGAWPMARHALLHKALPNRLLRRYGFVIPSDLAAI